MNDIITVNKSQTKALNFIKINKGRVVVLDFDYTLFLKNSTDSYLNSIFPSFWGYLIVRISDRFTAVLAKIFKTDFYRWQDFFRVFFATFFCPYLYIVWLIKVNFFYKKYFNNKLIETVNNASPLKIIIISFGFKHIIKPLTKHLPFKTTLITSSVWMPFNNIRKKGKDVLIKEYIDESTIKNAIFITDSTEDNKLLELFKNSYLVQWCDIEPPPFHNVYIPFRYTTEGKYPGLNILINQIFGEDLIILYLAYHLRGFEYIALIFFFISFFCVYEMGYYENDFKSALKENNPTLSKTYNKFKNYRINTMGWTWASITGFLGVSIVNNFIITKKLLFETFIIWSCVLISVRLGFFIFNKIDVTKRQYLFPFLQYMKTFSYITVFSLTTPGVILLFSQIMRQTSNYIIYRNNGNVKIFKRQAHRLLIFTLVCVIFITATKDLALLHDRRFYLIAAWIIYRVMREKFGSGLLPLKKTINNFLKK